jgi:ABC-type cobalamin transport system ATPase subunit
LLLDEPAAGLNLSEKKALHGLLGRIVAQGLTILLIDHDMTLIAGAARNDRSWRNAAPLATQASGAENLVIFDMTSLTSACS